MGAGASRTNYQVGLTKKELERLQRRFQRASGGRDRVGIVALQQGNQLDNPFVQRAFELFDEDRDGYLSLSEFTKAVDLLGNLNTEDEQVQLAFSMFDLDGSGTISVTELRSTLEAVVGRALSAAQLGQTVQSLVAAHDLDGDGELSLPEFKSLLAASNATTAEEMAA